MTVGVPVRRHRAANGEEQRERAHDGAGGQPVPSPRPAPAAAGAEWQGEEQLGGQQRLHEPDRAQVQGDGLHAGAERAGDLTGDPDR
ncbi:MAG TPA: hypothetical protein VGP16_28730 [Asanoa sp.]|nr:hypothetical protein [Asanoa sp.]